MFSSSTSAAPLAEADEADRDEIREVSPGLYLGIMYKAGSQKMFFTLDARQ
jgi:hypothetical protein